MGLDLFAEGDTMNKRVLTFHCDAPNCDVTTQFRKNVGLQIFVTSVKRGSCGQIDILVYPSRTDLPLPYVDGKLVRGAARPYGRWFENEAEYVN